MTERILVVDDEQDIRHSLEIVLGGAGYQVMCAKDGEEALAVVEAERPHAVFLDIELPKLDGMEVLRRLRAENPDLPVVMITGHATIERAVQATRLGAYDFVEKPFSRERILLLARTATEIGKMGREVARLRTAEVEKLRGACASMRALRESIQRVAPTDKRVLILGESGTGKELVACALHSLSARSAEPFIQVNCAAIPDELIEAELFGAVAGAYTGAASTREGRFAAADRGTLFLDEIGDMSLRAQAKVLRVLQEGAYEPVGSTRTVRVDVRVVAATHQDLPGLVADGLFRQDLLFRLKVIPLEVPPLRERAGDVRLLGEHFLAAYAARDGIVAPRLSEASWRLLDVYPWPGNVRELQNVIEQIVLIRPGAEVGPEDLPPEVTRGVMNSLSGHQVAGANPYVGLRLQEARDAVERDVIRAALERHYGNVTRAAVELGLERTNLHHRINALGLGGE
jgi:two-component system nitrogen regulation response regulator NtrX